MGHPAVATKRQEKAAGTKPRELQEATARLYRGGEIV